MPYVPVMQPISTWDLSAADPLTVSPTFDRVWVDPPPCHVETLGYSQSVSEAQNASLAQEVMTYVNERINRAMGEALMSFIREKGPCMTGPITVTARLDPYLMGTQFNARMHVLPIMNADDADWREMERRCTRGA